ncbi:MAG: ribose-phosphate pyrophosphokinase [Bacteroidales bacterium]|jgi:ribose-phosphate pyrophosphokinase|nr:ribose-phosphate pyrophosphokinase [Bacteroidales bacterium]
MEQKIIIFSGRASRYLSEKIAEAFGQELGKSEVLEFSDGEILPALNQNVRGADVFIVQSTFAPAENILELFLMIDAAKRASARRIIAVIPYFGYARQDRKDRPRVSIGSKLIADLLTTAGVSRVIAMDLHADQIQGFFSIPVDHVFASQIFVSHLRTQLDTNNVIFASPDVGGARRVNVYAKALGTSFVICYKQRNRPNEIGSIQLIGDVEGKDVILVDDIIDTGNTICKAAKIIKESGAKSVRAMVTHPLLTGNGYQNIENSVLEELIVTDTIPLKKPSEKITVLSTAKTLAEVIKRVEMNESISDLYSL